MSELERQDDAVDSVDIAVVGMACRFPDANNASQFWENLSKGHESLKTLSDEQLRNAGVPDSVFNHPDYVRAGMFLEDFDCFDAEFFGFSPKEASIMDPQHRVFLETSWEAFENAGYNPSNFEGPIGVFAGSGHNAYFANNILTNPSVIEDNGFFLLRHTGNDKDFLTTRVSYCLDLKGPSLAVQTACSTSLVATHLAIQSLVRFECDMALAGGVTIELPAMQGYLFKENEILSPDGHCRPFDEKSNGTVFGNGAGVVVLKRLEDALEDGDCIHAIIRSSAINNDGLDKVSYLAPSVDGQAASVEEALGIAEIDPASITYIECHGTGTRLGDPIEVEALNIAYQGASASENHCALGSVKSNIGHLDTAAGVAGMIKTIQALKHAQIPPTLHYETPNSAINIENTPFYVNSDLRQWVSDGPRRAGINSLGVGGTNVHMILEEGVSEPGSKSREHQLLLISARSSSALDTAKSRFKQHLLQTEQPLADIAYTSAVGRKAFNHRCFAVGENHAAVVDALDSNDVDRSGYQNVHENLDKLVFMFAGGGAQYPNMGLDLYRSEPAYADALDQCFSLSQEYLTFDLKKLLFPTAENYELAAQQLTRPSRALPALMCTQYAQAVLWQSWGVRADAYIGHSMGEYTAGCLAGLFSLRSAIAIVSKRGTLFEQFAPGSMLSVMMTEEDLLLRLKHHSDVSIAAVNGPCLCVASGPEQAISQLHNELDQQDIGCQKIHINVAAHSAMVEPILSEFEKFMDTIEYGAIETPIVSNLTGDWLTDAEATHSNYWVKHLRQSVRFYDGINRLVAADSSPVLLEVGPGKTLISAARQHPEAAKGVPTLPSMRHVSQTHNDQAFMLAALGRLWASGLLSDLDSLYQNQKRLRVEIPTYPFKKDRHWIEPGKSRLTETTSNRSAISEWFYRSEWTPSRAIVATDYCRQLVMVIGANQSSFYNTLCQQIQSSTSDSVTVQAGASFAEIDPKKFEINPRVKGDYERLFQRINADEYDQISVVYSFLNNSVTTDYSSAFFNLLALSQALNDQYWPNCVLNLVTQGSLSVGPGELVSQPAYSALLGASRVLSHEIEGLKVRYFDIDVISDTVSLSSAIDWVTKKTAYALSAEISQHCLSEEMPANQVIAYRKGVRHLEDYQPIALETGAINLKVEGCYVISGGLGGLGLQVAKEMASQCTGVHLVLLSRTTIPARETWPLDEFDNHSDFRKVNAVLALEALGATVHILSVDVADEVSLQHSLQSIPDEFGSILGVIHAAGVIQDNLLSLKSDTDCAKVLSPKVNGAVNLAKATSEKSLEFFILFSSISSIAGLVGQIDYAAANAFLDGYALHLRAETGVPAISVNWSAWQKVGMAAKLAEGAAPGEAITPHFHERTYRQSISTEDWLLDEHRTKAGTALVPGTGFLELTRKAGEHQSNAQAQAQAQTQAQTQTQTQTRGSTLVELRDVFFLAPLVISDSQIQVIDVSFSETPSSALGTSKLTSFHLRSAKNLSAAQSNDWLSEHVEGKLALVSAPSVPVKKNLEAILSRCQQKSVDHAFSIEHEHMNFGHRWGCLKTVHFGVDEACMELKLPREYESDLRTNGLHPAMLDMVTATAFQLVPEYSVKDDFFVPVSYGRVTFHQPMIAEVVGYVNLKRSSNNALSYFDIQLFNPSGELLVDIVDFVAKRMPHNALDVSRPVETKDTLGVDLSIAITPEEGRLAFQYILSNLHIANLVVSPTDFRVQFEASRFNTPEDESVDTTSNDSISERSESLPKFEPAVTSDEKSLAELWQKTLGIKEIGIDDNFFELGGHSLMLTQLVGKAKKLLGIDLPLSQLFDNPTIKNWAQLSKNNSMSEAKPVSSPIKRVSRDAFKTQQ